MLFTLLLANIRILSCLFFLFFAMISKFLAIPAVREEIRVKIALAVPTAAPTTLTEEIIQTPPLAALKTIKILSM